uniref:Transposase n=1 Tax=Panagrellus redivivus TaxID=6233 RepID=A0A7E4W6I4_PANRE
MCELIYPDLRLDDDFALPMIKALFYDKVENAESYEALLSFVKVIGRSTVRHLQKRRNKNGQMKTVRIAAATPFRQQHRATFCDIITVRTVICT